MEKDTELEDIPQWLEKRLWSDLRRCPVQR